MSITWTSEQSQAITFDRDENLLVSAAAGSGKTAVLTERVLQRALRDKVAPEELLVVTFTDKAAENMRRKISEKLGELALDPERLRETYGKTVTELHELQQRFALAQISTIHSFCLTLIRDNLRDLTDSSGRPMLEPGFLTIDQEMASIYLNEAVDEVLDDYYMLYAEMRYDFRYDRFRENFRMLRAMFDRGQSDAVLREGLLETHGFLRSIGFYRTYVNREMKRFKQDGNIETSATARYFIRQFVELVKENYGAIKKSFYLPFYENQVEVKDTKEIIALRETLDHLMPIMEAVIATDPDELTWDMLYESGQHMPEIRPLTTPRANSKPETREEKLAYMEMYEARALPILQMLTGQLNENQTAYKRYGLDRYPGVFTMSGTEYTQQNKDIHAALKLYFEILFKIDDAYQAKKRAANQLDFSDYEHYALQLLSRKEIREQIADQYREIYIDEYQDTSYVQEEIISLIAHRNRFMVGDIKQSIYRFRHAAPQLFEAKLDSYHALARPLTEDIAEAKRGNRILLNANFRSRPAVLDYINALFHYLLTRETGDIDYDDTQALIAGREAGRGTVPAIRVALVNNLEPPADLPPKKRKQYPKPISLYGKKIRPDAEWIALDILQNVHRGSRIWGDYAILCPTHAECDMHEKILTYYGIPVDRFGERHFLDTRELRFLESVLRVFRNFNQDIPLATLMRSPLIERPFKENELLKIANSSDDFYFHEKVRRYAAERDDALATELNRFLETYGELRELSQLLPLSEWLETLIARRDYRGYLASLPYAEQRLDDVNQFVAWGEAFQKKGGSLHQFAEYVYQIRQRGSEMEMTEAGGVNENSVKIMTIHASKGLEFPVVYLADLHHALADRAVQGSVTLSFEGGISAYYADPELDRVFNTPRNYRHERLIEQKSYAEKIRLLYVAMTRAEEQLILVAEEPDQRAVEDVARIPRNNHIAYRDLLGLKSYRDWILAALRQHNRSLYDAVIAKLGDSEHFPATDPAVDVAGAKYFRETRMDVATDRIFARGEAKQRSEIIIPPSPENVKRIKHLIAICDPEPLTLVPNKWTVTEWKRAQFENAPVEDTTVRADGRPLPGMRDMAFTLKRPEEETVTAKGGTAFGTLVHNLARFLPDDAAETITDPARYARYIDGLIADKRMLAEERDPAMEAWPLIRGWIASDLFAKLAAADHAYHEIPFTLAVDPPGMPDSPIKTLVQGIIDLWFEYDGAIYLIDFKSDSLYGDDARKEVELIRRYGMQLHFYRAAIEKIMKRDVDHTLIWLFRDAKAVAMPDMPEI